MDTLKKLEIQKLLKEYDLLKLEEQYKKEVIDKFTSKFIDEVYCGVKQPSEEGEVKPTIKTTKAIKKISDDSLTPETKKLMKKLFRDVMKKTHPDATNTDEFVDLYNSAKLAYETNDLIGLSVIGNELKVEVNLNEGHINTLRLLLDKEKEKSIDFKNSYLWLWVHTKTDVEKEKIIQLYVERVIKN
jgi:hypothetical protein